MSHVCIVLPKKGKHNHHLMEMIEIMLILDQKEKFAPSVFNQVTENCKLKLSCGPELLQDKFFKLKHSEQLKLQDHFNIICRPEPIRRPITTSIPQGTKGIVIHENYLPM